VVSRESGYLGLIGGIGQLWSTGPFASGYLARKPVFKEQDIPKRDLFLVFAFGLFQNVILVQNKVYFEKVKRVKIGNFGVQTSGPRVPFGQNS